MADEVRKKEIIPRSIILEIKINGEQVCPTHDEDIVLKGKVYDKNDVPQKNEKGEDIIEEKGRVYLSKLEVESVIVEWGALDFAIEVNLFDPTMVTLDYLLYGSNSPNSYQKQIIEVTLGWEGKEYTGGRNVRVYKGMLAGVTPTLEAGGMRYMLTYINLWENMKLPGLLNTDGVSDVLLHESKDVGCVRILTPKGYEQVSKGNIIDGNSYCDFVKETIVDNPVTPYYGRYIYYWEWAASYKFMWDWKLFDIPRMLLDKSIYELMSNFKLYTNFVVKRDVGKVAVNEESRVADVNMPYLAVNVDGKLYKLFSKFFIDEMLSDDGGVSNYMGKVFKKYYKIYNPEIFGSFPIKDYIVSEDLLSVNKEVAYLSLYKVKDPDGMISHKSMMAPCNVNNTFNIFHILFCYAAMYGYEIKIHDNLKKIVNGYVQAFDIQDFVANKVVPFYWDAILDFVDSKCDESVARITKLEWSDLFGKLFKYKGYFLRSLKGEDLNKEKTKDFDGKTKSSLLASLFMCNQIHLGVKLYIEQAWKSVDVDVERLNEVISKKFTFLPNVDKDNFLMMNRDNLDVYESILKNMSGKYLQNAATIPMDLYNPKIIKRESGKHVLTFLQDLFEKYGYYYENGLEEAAKHLSSDVRPPMQRLYLSVTTSKDSNVIQISGQPLTIKVSDVKMFKFPRQDESGDVIDFKITADKALFMPIGDVNSYKNYFVTECGYPRVSVSKNERPFARRGEGMPPLMSGLFNSKQKEAIEKSGSLHANMLRTSIYSGTVRGMMDDAPFDVVTAEKLLHIRRNVDVFHADLTILGNPSLELNDYIYLQINNPDYSLNRLSGIYMVLHVRQSVNGGQYITELELVRMAMNSNIGRENVLGVITFEMGKTVVGGSEGAEIKEEE